LIYNTWRGVRTVKKFTSPVQPRTSRQLAIRAHMISCARAWAGLTSTVRAAWTTWADDHPVIDWTGSSIRITGANAYSKLTTRLIDMGFAAAASAPTVNAPTEVLLPVATGGAGQISLAFTAYTGTATQVDCWLYGPHSAGISATIRRARHRAYGAAETTPLVMTGLAPGLWSWWIRHISETDGQASTWVTGVATVT
jgi:hypothetical protein